MSVLANSNKLQQVFMNLLDNAEQHMPEHGTFTISLTKNESGFLQIQFHDTGVGILSKNLPHIFEPFFTTRKGGTGLGLSIVKKIVENHGGKIHFTNNIPPPGITVKISLPLSQP